jgi:hypothetical protein
LLGCVALDKIRSSKVREQRKGSGMSLCAVRKLAKLTLVGLLAALWPFAGVRGATLEVSAELGGRYESNVFQFEFGK